jgi:hypothetical protein
MKNNIIILGILAIFIIVILFYNSFYPSFQEGLDDNIQETIKGFIKSRKSPNNPDGSLSDEDIIRNIELLGSSHSQITNILSSRISIKDAVDKFALLVGQDIYDPLEDGLVIHYKFDKMEEKNIIRNSSKNNYGVNPSEYNATVHQGKNNPQPIDTIIDSKNSAVNTSCLYLNGLSRSDPATNNSSDNGAYLTIPTIPTFYNSTGFLGMAISVWFLATEQNGNWSRIFDFANNRDNDNIVLSPSSDSNNPRLGALMVNNYWNPWSVYWGDYVCDSSWRHVVWSISKEGLWTIYINGNVVSNSITLIPTNIRRDRNYIGKSNWNQTANPPADWDDAYNGWIDDFRIYQRELTSEHVNILYAKGGRLQEKNNHFWVMPDTQNKWYDNNQGFRNMGKLKDLGILSNTNMTIAFWLNIKNSEYNWRNIFLISNDSKEGGSSRIPALYIYPKGDYPNSINLHFRFGTPNNWNDGLKEGGGSIIDYDPVIDFPFGKDIHIAFTIDKKTIKYYHNGVLKYTRTLNNNTRFLNNTSNTKLYMNSYNNCNNVKLKNFQIFNRSLLPDEIMTVYSQTVCG